MGWGGVGRGNNVHVPVHTQAQQPHHLSCCPADTGTALSRSDTGGVGWGGVGYSKRSTFRRSKRTPDRCDPYGLLHRHHSLSCRSWHAPSDYVEKNKSAGQEEVNADGPPFDALGWCT